MFINGKQYQSIWFGGNSDPVVRFIDQHYLPWKWQTGELHSAGDVFTAIRDMKLRGAPLIGVAAAFGIYLAVKQFSGKENFTDYLNSRTLKFKSARPTAVNLSWAVDRVAQKAKNAGTPEKAMNAALNEALLILELEKESCRMIGVHGLPLLKEISLGKKGEPVNILTHCNAGWLACVDYGTATAPIYLAHDNGIKVHVWVDETRPRNQGARLTAWELLQHGVPHTVIADNTGGHLMQHGLVDIVMVGCDRATANGDAANKIGTYLKALAAKDNNIPFHVALPTSTIDFNIADGLSEIQIEERDPDEVRYMEGYCDNEWKKMLVCPEKSPAVNYGFDVTPARLITSFITEKGLCRPDELCSLKK